MGAQLQLIGEASDDQIATEPQRRSGVIKCPPDTSGESIANLAFGSHHGIAEEVINQKVFLSGYTHNG